MNWHTPGPWHWDGKFTVTIPNAVGMTAFCMNPDDGRLIAAAPDMLKALRDTLTYWTETGFAECDPGCDCIVDAVRAAIAKTEG